MNPILIYSIYVCQTGILCLCGNVNFMSMIKIQNDFKFKKVFLTLTENLPA
jgi:hypothetical protein